MHLLRYEFTRQPRPAHVSGRCLHVSMAGGAAQFTSRICNLDEWLASMWGYKAKVMSVVSLARHSSSARGIPHWFRRYDRCRCAEGMQSCLLNLNADCAESLTLMQGINPPHLKEMKEPAHQRPGLPSYALQCICQRLTSLRTVSSYSECCCG